MIREILESNKMSNEIYNVLNEIVTRDCTTGPGEATTYGEWSIFRTKHLDQSRGESGIERDYGFTCIKFKLIIALLVKKRPFEIVDGHYNLMYKQHKKYQEVVINVESNIKKITFITIMTLNKNKMSDYRNPKYERRIYIGEIK